MTDDQFWRVVILGAVGGLMVVYGPQIKKFMHRIGYRDWREPPEKKTPETRS